MFYSSERISNGFPCNNILPREVLPSSLATFQRVLRVVDRRYALAPHHHIGRGCQCCAASENDRWWAFIVICSLLVFLCTHARFSVSSSRFRYWPAMCACTVPLCRERPPTPHNKGDNRYKCLQLLLWHLVRVPDRKHTQVLSVLGVRFLLLDWHNADFSSTGATLQRCNPLSSW